MDILILYLHLNIERNIKHLNFNIMTKQTFIIQDWVSNRIFPNKTFKSFEDGWEFIYTNVDNSLYEETENEDDNEYQEYYVIEINN